MTLSSTPLPLSRPEVLNSAVPCGWMKISTPSSSALAQNGWNLGSESSSVDAAANQRPAQSEPLGRMFELIGREIGVLQGNRRQADEPIRLCRADVGELLVLQLDDLTGEVGLCLGPKDRVETERLDVDALLIHHLGAFRRDHERLQLHLQTNQRVRLRHVAMGMQVDGPNALSIDNDFASLLRCLRECRARQAAPDSRKPGQRSGSLAEHFPTV